MSIKSEMSEDSGQVTISVEGHFDFNTHQEFRNAYKKASPDATFTINLSKTDFVDSSALGMLLLLREFAGGDESDIRIIGCNENVNNVFIVSNFNKLFKFE